MAKSKGSKAIIILSVVASVAIISTGIGIGVSNMLKDGFFSDKNATNTVNTNTKNDDNSTKVEVTETDIDNKDNPDINTDKDNNPSTPTDDTDNNPEVVNPTSDEKDDKEEKSTDKDEEKEDKEIDIDDDGTINLKYKEGGLYVDDTYYTVDQLVDGGYINFDASGVLSASPSKLNTFNNFVLTIPSGITKISSGAFKGCEKITKVYFPTSLTDIGSDAFNSCTNLESARLLPTIKNIGNYAFSYSGLTDIYIPAEYTSVNLTAFWWLEKVASITVENGHSKYDSRENCNAIVETSTNTIVYGCEKTEFTSSIKKIGESAFMTCKGYMRFTIPETIEEIGDFAFENSNIMTVDIKNSNIILGKKVFYSCKELYYAKFPDEVEEIPDGCFYKSPYTTFTFPKNLKRIGSYAFYENEDFCRYRITIPKTVKYIGDFAFYGAHMNELVFAGDYYNGVVEIGESAFENCKNIKADKLLIPSDVEKIGKNAFNGCTNINSISIPSDIKNIAPFSLDVGQNKNGEIEFRGDKDMLEKIQYNYYKGSSRIKCMW